jgi:hypothetical protein
VLTRYSEQCQIVGASLNLTTACPSSAAATCQVSCQDPKSPSQCVVLNSQLVDGSPCGEHNGEFLGCFLIALQVMAVLATLETVTQEIFFRPQL